MARFVWAVGGQTAELTLAEPLKFRGGSLGRVRTRYRSISLDQRTVVTELLTQNGADTVEGRLRFHTEPAMLSAMVEDAASGALLTYEHSNGLVFSDLLLEDVGNLTEIRPDEARYGFGEWERTLRLRHVGGTSTNILGSPEAFDVTADWEQLNAPTVTSNTGLAPDQTLTADTVEDDSSANLQRIRQTPPDTAGRYLCSIFVEKASATGSLPNLQIQASESTVQRDAGVNFDPATGDFALVGTSLGSITVDHGVADIGDWLWVYIVFDHDADGADFFVQYIPAHTATVGGAFNSTLVGSQRVWGAQLVSLGSSWTAGSALPAYVPRSRRVLWQLFPPVSL